jgi:hypothetical protein
MFVFHQTIKAYHTQLQLINTILEKGSIPYS